MRRPALRRGSSRCPRSAVPASPILGPALCHGAAGTDEPDAARSQALAHGLATPHGKKLYARRKHTPEPGFGIIKSVLGFRQFLLRGLDKVRGEWSLVTMACNMKRILALATRPREHWAIVTQPPPGQPATLRQVSNPFSLALSTHPALQPSIS